MQTTFISTPARKLVVGLTLAAGAILAFASTACTVTVSHSCGGGLVDCGGHCVDLNSNPDNCGACGYFCGAGEYCDLGTCVVGTCLADNVACTFDGECCSYYCASDGLCGCIPSNTYGCAADSDCCSNFCDLNTGICN